MSEARTKSTTPKAQGRRRNSRLDVPAAPPPMPPPSADEQAKSGELLQMMKDLVVKAERRNLDAAVELALQAARGEGPLVDHFMELGRRFGWQLRAGPAPARKTTLRVIDGGKKAEMA